MVQLDEDLELELANGTDKMRFYRTQLRFATPEEIARYPFL